MKILALLLGAAAMFVVSLLGVMAATGTLNQDALNRLLGAEAPTPEPEAEAEESLDPITQQMKKRETELADKAAELKEWEAQLSQRQAELDALYEQVQAKQQELQGTVDAREEARQMELTTVANTLSNMKPKNAAERIENMPVEDIVEVLRKVEDKDRGKIVESMSLETASEVLRKMQDPPQIIAGTSTPSPAGRSSTPSIGSAPERTPPPPRTATR